MSKCTTYGQMCHFWENVPFMGKCAIYGQMCHLWANMPSIGKCVIYRQMCLPKFDENLSFFPPLFKAIPETLGETIE